MSYVVNSLGGDGMVAFLRLTEGGTVKLNTGDTVPAEADLNHVAALVDAGVLTQVGEVAKPNGVEAILEIVGNDPEKAQAYLEEERAAARPRKTLIEALEDVVAGRPS